jgi:hypothetical protein
LVLLSQKQENIMSELTIRRQPNYAVHENESRVVQLNTKDKLTSVARAPGVDKWIVGKEDTLFLSTFGAYVAGSAAAWTCDTTFEYDDIDVYFPDHKSFSNFEKEAKAAGFEKHPLHYCKMVDTVFGRKMIQIASDPYWHVMPKILIEHFDFTICMFAFDLHTGELFHHADAPDQLKARKLVIHSLPNPLMSCYRGMRYISRGFTIDPDQAKVMARAVKAERAANMAMGK